MSTQAIATGKKDKKYIHYLITAIIIFGSTFMPQIGPVTPMGWAVLGTFIGVIYGWTFVDMLWPSILGLVGLGYVVGMSKVLAQSFGSPVMPLIFMVFAFLPVLKETGLTEVIAKMFMANRLTKGRPWVFIFFYLLGGYVCAQINVFVSMILMTGILLDLCKKLGIKPYSPFLAVMLIGLSLSIQLSQILFPFKGSGITLAAAYSAMTGEMPNFVQYTGYILPMGIVLLIAYTLVCRFIFRVDVTPLKNITEETFGGKSKLTQDQKYGLFFLVFLIFMMMSTSILPKGLLITQFLTKITVFGQAAIVILLCMLVKRPDGTRFFDFGKYAARGMDWGSVFMVAFILPVSNFLTADETGIKELLSMILKPLTQFSPVVFIVIAMLFAALVTNFANNVILSIVILPVMVTFAGQMGLPPLSMACLLFVGTQLALFTPGASVCSGMAFAQTEWVKAPMMMRYGLIAVIVLLAIFLIIGIPFAFMIF